MTDLAAALLADVPIRGRIYTGGRINTGGNCLNELVCKKDVLAALSAHLDADLAERAGEVVEGVTPGPWRKSSASVNTKPDESAVAVCVSMGTRSREEAENNARFIAWCREGVPALLAQNAALRANTVQMLDEADREYNRKTNDMIERHAEQLAALRAERDETYAYAKRLAEAIFAKGEFDAPQWRPLDDTLGVLTQIDNMVAGIRVRAEAAEAEVEKLRGALELIADTDPDEGTAWFHTVANAALTTEKRHER